MTTVRQANLANESALRAYLWRINNDGDDPTAAGVDASGFSFLAMIRGPYGDDEVVLFNTPWDGETSTIRGYRCEACSAQEPARFPDLHFPVTLLQVVKR